MYNWLRKLDTEFWDLKYVGSTTLCIACIVSSNTGSFERFLHFSRLDSNSRIQLHECF